MYKFSRLSVIFFLILPIAKVVSLNLQATDLLRINVTAFEKVVSDKIYPKTGYDPNNKKPLTYKVLRFFRQIFDETRYVLNWSHSEWDNDKYEKIINHRNWTRRRNAYVSVSEKFAETRQKIYDANNQDMDTIIDKIKKHADFIIASFSNTLPWALQADHSDGDWLEMIKEVCIVFLFNKLFI